MKQSVKDILADNFWIMPATPEYIDKGVPYITSKNIKNGTIDFSKGNYISQEDYENISKNRPILVGDILISMIGTLGETAEVKRSDGLFYGQNMYLVRIDESKVNKRYFLNFFKSNFVKRALEGKQNQSTQKYLKANHIEDLIIPVPDVTKQELIAKQLDKLAYIITLRTNELKQLDELIKARFVELFGFPGTDEKGWGLRRLGECCEINPKKVSDKRLASGMQVSFVPMTAVSENGAIKTAEKKTYDEVKVGFTYFAENDVLFAKITPCMENGKGAVAVGLCNGIGFGSTEFHVLRPINGKSNPYWLYSLISFDTFRKDAATNMTGSAGQRRVPSMFLEKYKITLPPFELQNQFADFVHQVDKSKVVYQGCSQYIA